MEGDRVDGEPSVEVDVDSRLALNSSKGRHLRRRTQQTAICARGAVPHPSVGRPEITVRPSPRSTAPGASRPASFAAVIAMGLFAGLSYTFTLAVMPGLTAADDRTLVDAMQQMIDNPAFPLTFLGAGALAAGALIQARRSSSPRTARWIVAGLALYTVWVVVTFAVHIPLNEDLKQADDPARIENLAAVRDDFVTPWVAWEVVRALATIAAFGSLTWALVLRGRRGRAEPGDFMSGVAGRPRGAQ